MGAEQAQLRQASGNLPVELTKFIGRERELEELRGILQEARLCTITGPGGSGKTRLAAQLARRVAAGYPDGVWFVDFGALADASLFTQHLARTWELREVPGQDLLSLLCAQLGRQQALVLLDGCEHLVEVVAAVVNQLLRSCPALTLLVTSQEALNTGGEVAWRIPSLSVPSPGDLDMTRVHPSEAVRLFEDRARLVSNTFQLNKETAPAVTEICRRLDGLPLAIELAAARIRVMPAAEIMSRLNDRFRLLTGGNRSAVARQQTLRAAVDWSYQQLTPTEQSLFRSLSVFSGSFSLAAVEAVCNRNALDSGESALELLSRLVDRSLVVPSPMEGAARYRLLETLRQYGQERLRDLDERDARRLHAEYFAKLAEEMEPYLTGRDQAECLRRLECDHDNFQSALAWAVGENQQIALRLVAALGRFWFMRGYVREARDWVRLALTEPVDASVTYSRALLTAGLASFWWGDYVLAREYGERSLGVARKHGPSGKEVGLALNQIGLAAYLLGDFENATRHHQEALAVRSQNKDHWGTAQSLNNLGLVALDQGRLVDAEKLLTESLALITEVEDRRTRATTLDSLARLKVERGELDSARVLYNECLEIAGSLGDQMTMADGLEGSARLAVKEGRFRRGLVLAATARKLRERIAYREQRAWQLAFDSDIEVAHSRLDKATATAAWEEGEALSLADAVALALSESQVASKDDGLTMRPLSDRELEIGSLLVDGLSNRQIGLRLKISERTVDAHVEHIRNKLAVRSRAQIAAWITRARITTPA